MKERYPNYSNEMGGDSGLTKHVLSSYSRLQDLQDFVDI